MKGLSSNPAALGNLASPVVTHAREQLEQAQKPGTTDGPPSADSANPELRLPLEYVGRGVLGTFKAFTLPTAAAGLLPPAYRWITPLAASQVFEEQLTRAQPLGFIPGSTDGQKVTASFIQFSPFAATFTAHAKLGTMAPFDKAVPDAINSAWKMAAEPLASSLPGAVAKQVREFPASFVLARGSAQVAAAAVGTAAKYAYLSHVTGGELTRTPAASAGDDAERPRVAQEALVYFAVPAALSSPMGAEMLKSLKLGPVGQTGVIVGSLIFAGTMVVNEAVRAGRQEDDDEAPASQVPARRLLEVIQQAEPEKAQPAPDKPRAATPETQATAATGQPAGASTPMPKGEKP